MLTTRAEVGSRKRKNGTFWPVRPCATTRKSPLALRSCCAEASVFRAYAFDPAVELSESCAANEPALTVVLCTVAVPSTFVCTWLQAEKSPDSNPSLNTVSALADEAPTSDAIATRRLTLEISPTKFPLPPATCSLPCRHSG